MRVSTAGRISWPINQYKRSFCMIFFLASLISEANHSLMDAVSLRWIFRRGRNQMKLNQALVFVAASVMFTACSTDADLQTSDFSSQVTQSWNFNSGSSAASAIAESSDNCATNLPEASLASGHCFNPTPVADVVSSAGVGPLLTLCVATNVAGSASQASLIVVDQQGRLASESFGNGSMQVLATVPSGSRYKVYVGFPSAGAGQRVKVLAGFTAKFSVNSIACSFK